MDRALAECTEGEKCSFCLTRQRSGVCEQTNGPERQGFGKKTTQDATVQFVATDMNQDPLPGVTPQVGLLCWLEELKPTELA